MSSTEAEFIAAADAGKIEICLHSLLKDLKVLKNAATILYEDNMGAYIMASAGQPDTRTRHMEIKYFALLSWVEGDCINVKHIKTTINSSDPFTKSTPCIIFYRHNGVIMGKPIP